MKAVTLNDLAADLAAVKGLSAAKQASAILLWHDVNGKANELTPKQVADVMRAEGLGNPRHDKLAVQIRSLRVTLAGSTNGTLKILIGKAKKVADWIGYELESAPEQAPDKAPKKSTKNTVPKKVEGAKETRVAKPSLFIASSVEGLTVAYAIQSNLEHDCEATVWSQGVFGLSTNTLEELLNSADKVDFAVAVLTADDELTTRGAKMMVGRDNCIIELGIFYGKLGRQRTFFVQDRDVRMGLPSDLAGIAPAKYGARADDNWIAALGAASNQIRMAMKKAGPRMRGD